MTRSNGKTTRAKKAGPTVADYQLLPTPSREEYERLREDIRTNGIHTPIVVDENGLLLDGHTRLQIATELGLDGIPSRTEKCTTDGERRAAALRLNLSRRQLSGDQMLEAREIQRAVARELRAEGKTQEDVARLLGVSRPTVTAWESTTNVSTNNGCPPDLRAKIDRRARTAIVERVEAGESQTQVAADFKLTKQAVSKILKAFRARAAASDDRGKPASAKSKARKSREKSEDRAMETSSGSAPAAPERTEREAFWHDAARDGMGWTTAIAYLGEELDTMRRSFSHEVFGQILRGLKRLVETDLERWAQ